MTDCSGSVKTGTLPLCSEKWEFIQKERNKVRQTGNHSPWVGPNLPTCLALPDQVDAPPEHTIHTTLTALSTITHCRTTVVQNIQSCCYASRGALTSPSDSILRLTRIAPAGYLSNTAHISMVTSASVVRQSLIMDQGQPHELASNFQSGVFTWLVCFRVVRASKSIHIPDGASDHTMLLLRGDYSEAK